MIDTTVTKAEKNLLKRIQEGDFVITIHARERMNERFVSELDIVEVARTLKEIRYQIANNTYYLSGLSTWKQDLALSVSLRENVVIVTVFYEDE